MTAMVEIRELTKRFPRANGSDIEAVKGINFQIASGEIYSLLGPNGAGKTTTISMITGLLEPSSGDALIGGYSILSQPLEAKKLMGIVPQEVALYPSLTAVQNLEFFGKMYDLRGEGLKSRVAEVLEFIGLTDRRDDRIETYSGGMKRRVNIGVGLLHHPKLIFMDEPTVGIDPQSRRRILDTVVQLRDEYGMTVLYTTHLMEEAQELSDRVAIIDYGEIIAEGTQGELIQRVGEEDRLIFNLGDQEVGDDLINLIQREVAGVSTVVYTPPSSPDREADDTSGYLTIAATRGRKALPDLIELAYTSGLDVYSVEVREPDLESVFLHLTGRALRD
jgi:ABC-2 type transport system ATP-binding protein